MTIHAVEKIYETGDNPVAPVFGLMYFRSPIAGKIRSFRTWWSSGSSTSQYKLDVRLNGVSQYPLLANMLTLNTGNGFFDSKTGLNITVAQGDIVLLDLRQSTGPALNSPGVFVVEIDDQVGIALDDLSDVVITSPADGQALVYDTGAWKNETPTPPPSALDDLSDVIITSPTTSQVLTFNGTDWINDNPGGGGGGNFLDPILSWTPPDRGNCTIWLKNETLAAMTDGATMSSGWADDSGDNNDFDSIFAGTVAPTVRHEVLGNRAGAFFPSNGNGSLYCANTFEVRTIIIIARYAGPSFQTYANLFGKFTTSNYYLLGDNGTTNFRTNAGEIIGGTSSNIKVDGIVDYAAQLQRVRVYENRNNASTSSDWILGQQGGGIFTTRGWWGDILEVIGYADYFTTTADWVNLYRYIQQKFGLNLNLDR